MDKMKDHRLEQRAWQAKPATRKLKKNLQRDGKSAGHSRLKKKNNQKPIYKKEERVVESVKIVLA